MLDKIQNDLKEAQLSRDEVKVSTLRLLLAEIKNANISKGNELSDAEIYSIIRREVKKRKEAAAGFRGGGREESARKEELEAKILESYLPARSAGGPAGLSNEELTKLIDDTINEVGATSLSDMGVVMGAVMDKTKGQADGSAVSQLVKERLSHD